jgi:hypothetical protein
MTGTAGTTVANPANTGAGAAGGGQLQPKQFMAQKRPSTDYERVACCAYYLTKYREMPRFKTANITKLNTESAGHFSNPSLAVQHATATYHYLSPAGNGQKQLTILGEAVVDALPDREMVKAALEEHKPRRRKKRRAGKKR